MIFDAVRIVLVATSHPGNIGSTARAMKTMGLKRLYLVTPRLFPDRQAHEMSAGAYDVLDEAVITESLAEALHGCRWVFATSARARDMSLPGLIPADAAKVIAGLSDNTEVAIVFGREHAGLTNDELLHAHYHLHIPSSPDFSSLNLAQAVQVIAYEIRIKHLQPPATVQTSEQLLASAQQIGLFYEHLEKILIDIDFLNPAQPKRLMQRLRRMFNRIHLESTEVALLRGILTQVQKSHHV